MTQPRIQHNAALGTFMQDLIADMLLVATSCAYAAWLARHKRQEPDWTWVEVAFGVGFCLAHAYAHGQRHGGDWRTQHRAVWRAFVLGGVPIVLGEVRQWLAHRGPRSAYQPYRSPISPTKE